jgi:phage shock protein PspC (stress-responsive transcriptional regulator)
MNEIRHIHLGRQTYTIAADAYKTLHDYIEAIKREAGEDVAEEVEMRIAELLNERSVTEEKVILPKDVAYVKEQLGTPSDFSDVDEAIDDKSSAPDAEKRLFRDTDNAMIAGVAAGLGRYLNIDPLIIRLVFVALTFAGASGILLYVILWLLVPEAKTKSERLQMKGLAVNVDTIKQAVAQADVEGAAQRVSSLFSRIVVRFAYLVLGLVGVGLVTAGVVTTVGAIFVLVFGLVRGLQAGAQTVFPVGAEQVTVLVCGVAIAVLLGGAMAAAGVALVRRRRIMPGWSIATMVALFVVASALGAGLAADAAPQIRQQYRAVQHERFIPVQPFTKLDFKGDNAFYISRPGPKAEVEIRSFGNVDTSGISVVEKDGVLSVDTTNYHPKEDCNLVCPFGITNTEVIVTVPEPISTSSVPMSGTSGAQVTVYGTNGRY